MYLVGQYAPNGPPGVMEISHYKPCHNLPSSDITSGNVQPDDGWQTFSDLTETAPTIKQDYYFCVCMLNV